MATKRRVKGSNVVSIVKDPTYPFNDGYAIGEVKKGEVVDVNLDRVVYDWHGNMYYLAVSSSGVKGYIITTALEEV